MDFRVFKAGHLKTLIPQPAQAKEHSILVRPEHTSVLEAHTGMSAWAGSACVAAAGCAEIFPHRAVAWAVLSKDAGPYMLPIIKKIRSVINVLPYRRIEMYVDAEFVEGIRMAELIGMKLETPEPLVGHGAFGQDEFVYARVRS